MQNYHRIFVISIIVTSSFISSSSSWRWSSITFAWLLLGRLCDHQEQKQQDNQVVPPHAVEDDEEGDEVDGEEHDEEDDEEDDKEDDEVDDKEDDEVYDKEDGK